MKYFKDNRVFKRYASKTDFSIVIEGNHYKAATVDFSLGGICIFIEGIPPVTLNSIIDLRIEDLGLLDIKGKVVWIKKTSSNLLVGIEKMAISGILKYYPLSDILLDLQRSDSTGTLEIKKGLIYKQIYIDNGVILFASSNHEEDRLEETLLKSGKLTADQYYQLVGIRDKEASPQVKALIDLGFLNPHELFLAFKYQAEEIILSLFALEDGEVTFNEGSIPIGIIRLKLNASNLIFQGIKRINKEEYFRNTAPPQNAVLYYSNEPINLFQDINLTETDRYVLSLMDGRLNIKEILSVSSLGSFQTLKTLCALLFIRMIDVKEKGILEDKSLTYIIEEPRAHVDEEFIKKVEELYQKCQSMDYYSILGINKDATRDMIRKAYFKNAKEYHPDRHFNIVSEEIKSRLNIIFTYNTNAYKILSDPGEKEKYDSSLKMLKPGLKNNKEIARKRFNDGREALRKGLYNEAFELLAQAAYLDNSVADYHFYFGLIYKHKNKLREAEKEINTALKLNPNNADYLAEMGHIYLELGFTLRARSTFEKALKLNPYSARADEGLEKIQNLSKNTI